MKAGIIAAGLGERLRRGGYEQPKPLVPINGRPLIDYALAGIAAAGVSQVACIVNEQSCGIEAHCTSCWPQLCFDFVRRTTPSSMESLFTLAPLLASGRFLLLTVDAVMAPSLVRDFCAATTARAQADGILAVTTLVDDEKPLWVRTNDAGQIIALGPDAEGSGLVTAGLYVFEPRIFAEIPAARAAQLTALRQFLGHLLARGYRLEAVSIGKSVDVDRPEDITVAESFVRNGFA
jgi:NDP-sugar pyrophosphorylase family protein